MGASRSDASSFKQAKLVEAVRRLYGETRFMAAVNKPKASPGPVGSLPPSRTKKTSNKRADLISYR
jgi:hypothetical protein